MQDAKRLARDCEGQGDESKLAKMSFSLIFSTYNSSKVNYVLNNNILYFKLSCVDI